jgi:nitrite reductase (NADH) small subunit
VPKRVCVSDIAQIPPGEGRTFAVDGLRLAVFHLRSGEVYATQAACPHAGGPLADGLTGGTTLICPLHERAYDLRTGEGLTDGIPVSVYPASLADDGTIWLQLPD